MPTLASILLGAALVSSTAPSASTTPTTGVNKVVKNEAAAVALWEKLLSGFGRVKGEIAIDEDVLPFLSGTCRDFSVQAYKYPRNSGDAPRGVTVAYGDISTGKCSYMLFVAPTKELWMTGQYEGSLSGTPPGNLIYMRGESLSPKRVWKGKTRVFNFLLTVGWVG